MTKTKLTKPEYHLNEKTLKSDSTFIKGQKYERAIRRRVPLFMDGYRYAAEAVKKRWGIDFTFFEAGHDQVKPCYPPSLLNKKGADIWWEMMNNDKRFAGRLVNEVRGIVDIEKKLEKSIPKHELSPKEIEKLLLAHLDWWIKFFEVGYLWFGVEDIKEKIDEEITREWKGNKSELKQFIESAYRPMKLPFSSVEQRDLLKLKKLKGGAFESALKKHHKKYRHLSLHNIDDEYFDIEYYRGRLELLNNHSEFAKAEAMLRTADEELVHADRIIKNTRLSPRLKERVDFVRWFMYIRTETIDHLMLVNGAYKPVFAALSKLFTLPVDTLLHMTYEEIITSLKKGKLSIPRDLIFERTKNGYAYLIATPPHKSYLVVGKEADRLHKFVIPHRKKEKVTEIKGQTAFKGKIRGVARVIVDRRNAHELQKGEILVTTMTSPEFVPAMKISGGIITNEGGILCHAAIMSREFHKPCVIGTKIATDAITTGQIVVLDADNATITLE